MGGFFPQAGRITEAIEEQERQKRIAEARAAAAEIANRTSLDHAARGISSTVGDAVGGLAALDATARAYMANPLMAATAVADRLMPEDYIPPTPKAADYAAKPSSVPPVPPVAAKKKSWLDTLDEGGGGDNRHRVGGLDVAIERQPFHTPDEAARIASRLEGAAERPLWKNDGSLGQIFQDASARKLLDDKYAAENERIDRDADANDPQKRDLEARKLNDAANKLIAGQRGNQRPLLGGVYDDPGRPDNYQQGLFEQVRDASGRDVFINNRRPLIDIADPKQRATINLLADYSKELEKASEMKDPAERQARIDEITQEVMTKAEVMGLTKNGVGQFADIIAGRAGIQRAAAEQMKAENERTGLGLGS